MARSHNLGWLPGARSSSLKQRELWMQPKTKIMAVMVIAGVAVGCTGGGSSTWWRDLWLTRDQQGMRALERSDVATAAQLFEDPMRRAYALYRSEQFEAAIGEWAHLDTAESWFNRGNALAHLEQYEDAVEAYERALELRPGLPAAEENIAYLQPFLPLDFEGGTTGVVGRDAAADEVVFDADPDRLKEQGRDTNLEQDGGLVTEEQMAAMWLQQVDTNPASFLRYKFQYQAAAEPDLRGDDR